MDGYHLPSSGSVRGAGALAGSRAALDPDWAMRIQTRMQNLERLVIAQNETISGLRNLLTRLPADPEGRDTDVASRIGSSGPLDQSTETVIMSSHQVPPSSGGGPSSPQPQVSPGDRPRAAGGPTDRTERLS
jgi:hypothetical protein